MWSFTAPFWESVFRWATISALAFGGIGIVSAFVSAWVGYEITDATQKEANLRIVDAQARSEAARADAARANEAAAQANERAANANEQTAIIEREAAEARAEQERLRSQLAWRRITQQQHDTIAAAIRQHPLSTPLDIAFPLGDAEAATLANEISRSFADRGLTISGGGAGAVVWMPTPPFGIILAQPGSEQVAHPIAQALAAAGLHLTIELQAPALKLVIGSKLAPF